MRIRLNPLVAVALAGLLSTGLQGCGATPRFDDAFGAATRANLAAQVINPAASRNAKAATGIDGAAAGAAHERYLRSFKNPPAGSQQTLLGGGDTK